MQNMIDLHCHWIAGIDDGVRTPEDGLLLLSKLRSAGFATVVATPHMRPGMFDNDRDALEGAYVRMQSHLDTQRTNLPNVHLASEHYFDDVVFERIKNDAGLPYPGGHAVLIEFSPTVFPARIGARLTDLKRRGLTTVVAHPERYQPVWEDDRCLDELLDAGAHLLLDVCAVVGKYGRAAQRAAEKLLEQEAYQAACSDAHKPQDVDTVVQAIDRLTRLVGQKETERLLVLGPKSILDGA